MEWAVCGFKCTEMTHLIDFTKTSNSDIGFQCFVSFLYCFCFYMIRIRLNLDGLLFLAIATVRVTPKMYGD